LSRKSTRAEPAREGWRRWPCPLDMRNDIRSMDADGVPSAEIARRPHASRNAVVEHADMEDMSPAPPLPAERR